MKPRIIWCYFFLFLGVLFLEFCTTCEIALFAISACGSSSRPSPCFGRPRGLSRSRSPCWGSLVPRGRVGARRAPIRQLRPTRTPAAARAHRQSCHMHCRSLNPQAPAQARRATSAAAHPNREPIARFPDPRRPERKLSRLPERCLPRPRTPHQPHQAHDCCPA